MEWIVEEFVKWLLLRFMPVFIPLIAVFGMFGMMAIFVVIDTRDRGEKL